MLEGLKNDEQKEVVNICSAVIAGSTSRTAEEGIAPYGNSRKPAGSFRVSPKFRRVLSPLFCPMGTSGPGPRDFILPTKSPEVTLITHGLSIECVCSHV